MKVSRLAIRIIALVLCLAVSGCAGYRTVSIPGTQFSTEESDEQTELFVGQSARVTLNSGEQESGEIVNLSEFTITLGSPSNLGFQEIEIPFLNVKSVEIEHVGKTESVIYGVLVGAGVMALVVWVLLKESLSGMGS